MDRLKVDVGENVRLTLLLHRLTEHATNKHNKTLKECFPTFVEAPKK